MVRPAGCTAVHWRLPKDVRSQEWQRMVVGYIKLQIPAGKANPSPPVGPGAGAARIEHYAIR